jgi:hypothetical protein
MEFVELEPLQMWKNSAGFWTSASDWLALFVEVNL